jgi:predicted nuclease of restriction endonuclease-like (RecB) superfamily
MRSLAEAWPDDEILQQLGADLPWGHNLRVLDRIKDRPTREWYLRAALEYGWSQDVLVLQIKSRLHEREGKALTNFQRELPRLESDTVLVVAVRREHLCNNSCAYVVQNISARASARRPEQ